MPAGVPFRAPPGLCTRVPRTGGHPTGRSSGPFRVPEGARYAVRPAATHSRACPTRAWSNRHPARAAAHPERAIKDVRRGADPSPVRPALGPKRRGRGLARVAAGVAAAALPLCAWSPPAAATAPATAASALTGPAAGTAGRGVDPNVTALSRRAPRQVSARRTPRQPPAVTVLRSDGRVTRVRASSAAGASALASQLARTDPGVVAAGVTGQVSAFTDPYESEEYFLSSITAPVAWAGGASGQGMVVAIVDSGIDEQHPDLVHQITGTADCTSGNCVAGALSGSIFWHGTHVAGIVAAARNGVDLTGVAPNARLLDVRVLDSTGSGDTASVAAGIAWAVAHGARVINLSLGGPDDDSALHAAIATATTKGVLVVAAAGNEYGSGDAPSYPAAYPEVLAVAATTSTGTHAPFSTTGGYVDIAAPGVGILSDVPGGQLGYADGTSMASPQVAAAAADVWSAHPTWTAAQVRAQLLATARDLGTPGTDATFGAGLVQVAGAALHPAQARTTPAVALDSPAAASYGARVAVRVRISSAGVALPGVGVALQWSAGARSPWRTLTTGRVGADGTAVLRFTATRTLLLRAVSTGTRVLGAGVSPTRTVQLAPALRLRTRHSRGYLVVSGRTLPAKALNVSLQRYDPRGRAWRTIARTRATARGQFSLRVRTGTHSVHLRVVTVHGGGLAAAASHSFVTRVR